MDDDRRQLWRPMNHLPRVVARAPVMRMPALRTYRVFISHAWHRSEHYDRVVRWLDEAPHFRWTNQSVPEHDPVPNETLEKDLRNQLRDADVFLILSGMYAAHSDWIDFELKWARITGRPILGVKPWGNERVPQAIQDVARAIVNWNGASIVEAIRTYAKPSA